MSFGWSVTMFCFLVLSDVARTSRGNTNMKPLEHQAWEITKKNSAEKGSFRQLHNSTIKPGFPVPIKTSDPGVQKAARYGVYTYNNSSNDIFLFKESCINKATVQIVRGLKYNLDVDICRTECTKRKHPSLDRCHFQKHKKLRQTFRCYFEVWLIPWLQRVEVLVSHCQ